MVVLLLLSALELVHQLDDGVALHRLHLVQHLGHAVSQLVELLRGHLKGLDAAVTEDHLQDKQIGDESFLVNRGNQQKISTTVA